MLKLIFILSFVAAIVLQLFLGCIDTDFFAFPLNVIILLFVIYIAFAVNQYCKIHKKKNVLASLKNSFFAICLIIYASLVIGFVPQYSPLDIFDKHTFFAKLGFHNFVCSWLFAAIIIYFMLTLTAVIIKRISAQFCWRNFAFCLNHIGLWIAVAAAYFGACDMFDAKTIVLRNQWENTAQTMDGRLKNLPYALQLSSFNVSHYETGEPRHFAATINVNENTKIVPLEIRVNSPQRYRNCDIYLSSYDVAAANNTEYCVVQIVRQPWQPLIYAGIFMLIVGSVLLFVFGLNLRKNDLE